MRLPRDQSRLLQIDLVSLTPDGLIVEFTQDPEDVVEIDAVRRGDAHSELARWLAGDRRTNNELRGRAF